MGSTHRQNRTPRARSLAIAAAGCLIAIGAIAIPALASKGVTKTGSTAFPADSKASASAACPARTHATGGGFAATPAATPGAGVESFTTNNNFSGRKTWTVTSGQVSGGHATTLTVKVRCERKSDGKIAILLTGGTTITPDTDPQGGYDATGQNLVFHCPPGTHPIAGGYQVAKPFDPNNAGTTNKFFATQTRRTGTTWTISGYLFGGPAASTPPAEFTGTVPCERNGSRRIVERSKTVPYLDNARATASAKCPKGRHLVSGGFAFTPIGEGFVPVPFVDQSLPATPRIWTVSAYDSAVFAPPVGSSLTTYAYCRRNFKKKRRARQGTAASSGAVGPGWVEVTPAPRLRVG
jgi:hypothetical protein